MEKSRKEILADHRIEQIVNAVDGMTYSDWSKVKVAIEKRYASMSSKLELSDTEALRKLLQLELKGIITP